MLKHIKSFYNFLMKLKQYHATHILIIPPALFFIISYTWFLYINILSWDSIDGDTALISLILFIIYLAIVYCSIFVALFVEIIILIQQVIKKKKICVKSDFLLNNRYYNIAYLLTLINCLFFIFHEINPDIFSDFYDFYSVTLYLLPWILFIK